MKLDYSLTTTEERVSLVNEILSENPSPSSYYLEVLSDYILAPAAKKEKGKITTKNRMVTIKKRETSFEGLMAQFPNGEDAVYALFSSNPHQRLDPKLSITDQDLIDIPELKEIQSNITWWENYLKTAKGYDRYIAKKTIIELRKEQYSLRQNVKPPMQVRNKTIQNHQPTLDDSYTLDANNRVIPSGMSLADPKVCRAILNNYSGLKEAGYGNFDSYLWYLMEDFDRVSSKALADYPIYEELVTLKIDGCKNQAVADALCTKFGVGWSASYVSALWSGRIPRLIASVGEDEILDYHFLNIEKGTYKTCPICKQVKLANTKYFSRNSYSPDGFYSICKQCRKERRKQNGK